MLRLQKNSQRLNDETKLIFVGASKLLTVQYCSLYFIVLNVLSRKEQCLEHIYVSHVFSLLFLDCIKIICINKNRRAIEKYQYNTN